VKSSGPVLDTAVAMTAADDGVRLAFWAHSADADAIGASAQLFDATLKLLGVKQLPVPGIYGQASYAYTSDLGPTSAATLWLWIFETQSWLGTGAVEILTPRPGSCPPCPTGEGCLPGSPGASCGPEQGPPAVDAVTAVTSYRDGHVHVAISGSDPDSDAVQLWVNFHGNTDPYGPPNMYRLPSGGIYGQSSFQYTVDLGRHPGSTSLQVLVADTAGQFDSRVVPISLENTRCTPDLLACPAGEGCIPSTSPPGSFCGTEGGPPSVDGMSATAGADGHLQLAFTGTDPDGDAIGGSVAYLDATGAVLGTASLSLPAIFGQTSFGFTLDLGLPPGAVASLQVTLIDTAGGTGSLTAPVTP
jgi:hypothetical protein